MEDTVVQNKKSCGIVGVRLSNLLCFCLAGVHNFYSLALFLYSDFLSNMRYVNVVIRLLACSLLTHFLV